MARPIWRPRREWAGKTTHTKRYNPYAYALNNPITRVDPSGQASILAQVAVTIVAGSIVSFAFGAQMAGTIGAVAGITAPPVMAFLLLALIFFALVTVMDISMSCAQATRHLSATTCDGTYNGLSLATLAGGVWHVTTDVGTELAPKVKKQIEEILKKKSRGPKWPFIIGTIVGVIIGIIVGGSEDPKSDPQPTPSPGATTGPNSPTVTPPSTVTPTETPDTSCDPLNESSAIPVLLEGTRDWGRQHIAKRHSFNSPDKDLGRFYTGIAENLANLQGVLAQAIPLARGVWHPDRTGYCRADVRIQNIGVLGGQDLPVNGLKIITVTGVPGSPGIPPYGVVTMYPTS